MPQKRKKSSEEERIDDVTREFTKDVLTAYTDNLLEIIKSQKIKLDGQIKISISMEDEVRSSYYQGAYDQMVGVIKVIEKTHEHTEEFIKDV